MNREPFSVPGRVRTLLGRPYYPALALKHALRPSPHRFVFVLGHMRSGSSLLAHILASHPRFVGFGETHVRYDSHAKFEHAVLKTRFLLGRARLGDAFVVDQVNHNHLVPNSALAGEPVAGAVVVIREPERSLASILALFGSGGADDRGWTEADALAYYCERLRGLTASAEAVRDRCALLVRYEELVERTDHVLAAMRGFFGVAEAFSTTYKTHRKTGIGGFGDPSTNILSGRVVRTPPPTGVVVGQETLAVAKAAFRAGERELDARCWTVDRLQGRGPAGPRSDSIAVAGVTRR